MPVLSPQAAKELVDQGGARIIDVREADEWEEVRIPGATHIPLNEVAMRASEIPRDRPTILQCRSGRRSEQATRTLLDLGFLGVHNLEGGILAWAAQDLPLERGGG